MRSAMLLWFVCGCAAALLCFQVWWLLAFSYAYSQVRATALLVQVAQGVAYVAFFAAVLWMVWQTQTLHRLVAPALLTFVFVLLLLWRVLGGPALLARYYPRRSRDVLLFRRPTVDFKRRVRGK